MNAKINIKIGFVVAAMIVATAPGTVMGDEEEPYAVFDTPQGIVELSEDEYRQLQQDQDHDCGGIAPALTFCLNVENAQRSGVSFGHGCILQNYNGAVESRIVHEGEDRVAVCESPLDGPASLHTAGQWPATGATFDHEGYSYLAGTYGNEHSGSFGLLSGGEPHGIPGGTGDWRVSLLNQ